MKTFKELFSEESKIHPMGVHVEYKPGNKSVVKRVGSKVTHVKPGDTVSSSDMDDLHAAGHKVKEV